MIILHENLCSPITVTLKNNIGSCSTGLVHWDTSFFQLAWKSKLSSMQLRRVCDSLQKNWDFLSLSLQEFMEFFVYKVTKQQNMQSGVVAPQ